VLDDTIEELRRCALEADDASGYFPALYARVTDRVQQAVADGRFGAPAQCELVARFARSFAGWYTRPRTGTPPIPRCWQASWDVAGDDGLLIVQHLLLGINAHVNHDLGQVVVGLVDDGHTLDEIRPGFEAVNTILGETYPLVVADLGRVSRWVGTAAAWGGGSLFNFSLRVARDQAWRLATRLSPLDADARRHEVAVLDDFVSGVAYVVVEPGWPATWIVPIARRFEDDDARHVSRTLLGPLLGDGG
jgi:hypothetical protein